MAETGIQRSDIISDEALRAPLEAAKNLEKMADSMDDVISKTKEVVTANEKNADSVSDISSSLAKLADLEQKMVNLQNKQAVEIKKLTDLQTKQKKEIEDLNKKLKDKKKAEEDSAKAVDALDKSTGGLISSFKELGKQLLALAGNPFVLVAAALVGTFFALKSAVEAFYKSSGEGEDKLAERISGWNAALDVLRNKWASFGKELDEAASKPSAFQTYLLTWVALFSRSTADAMQEAYKVGVENAKTADTLADDLIDNILERSKKEQEVAELLYKSKQKNLFSDKERLEFLKQSTKISEEIVFKEVELAARELDILQKQIASRHNITQQQLLQLTREEQMALLSEDELHERTKLFEAEAKIVNLRTAFFQEQRRTASSIAGLEEEIEKDRLAAIEKRSKAEEAAMKKRFELTKKMRDDEIKFQDDILANFLKDEEKRQQKDDEILAAFYEKMEGRTLQVEEEKDAWDGLIEKIQEGLRIAGEFIHAIGSLFTGSSQRRVMQLQEEEQRNQEKLDRELKAAEGNEEKQRRLKEQSARQSEMIEKRIREEKRKSAIYDKAVSFASAAINIATEITKVLARPLMVALVATLGAIQLAAISARPIPALRRGVKRFFGGFARVSEEGPELVVEPSRRMWLTPDEESIVHIPEGSTVISHNETMKMTGGGTGRVYVSNLKDLQIPDYVRMDHELYEVRKFKDGSRQYIRKQIFG